MAFVPDIKFNNIISPIYLDDDVEWTGGYTQRDANQSNIIKTGKVLSVSFSEFNPQRHNSEANALEKVAFTFKNGNYVKVFVWCETILVNGPCKFKVNTYTPQGTAIGSLYMGPTPLVGRTNTGSEIIEYSTWPEDLKAHGCKFYFYTDYYDANSYPVYDVTSPYGFAVRIAFPLRAYSAGHADYFNMLEGVTSNKSTFYDFPNDSGAGVMALNVAYTRDVNSLFQSLGYDDPSQGFDTRVPTDPDEPPVDPSQEDDPSGPGGGGGNMDNNSDPIPFPELPTGGAIASGAIKAFLVPDTTVKAMFQRLWNANIFDIATFQKLVESPIDCIISLHCIPVTPETHGTSNIILGSFDTELLANVITNQYLTIDCGSLNIKEYWGSALDYSPYTKVDLYMPFIGIRQLNIDDIMKSTVHIKYNVDVLTGDCLCNIMCGKSVLYKYAGNFRMDMPVTARTANGLLNTVKGTVAEVGGAIAGTAIGGPALGAATGFLSGAATVAGSKVMTSRSGSLVGAVSLMDDFRPFFIFHRPIQSLANNFKGHKGYPSNITRTLSSVRGYTEVEYINLQKIPNATQDEMEEIKTLLKKGVIF